MTILRFQSDNYALSMPQPDQSIEDEIKKAGKLQVDSTASIYKFHTNIKEWEESLPSSEDATTYLLPKPDLYDTNLRNLPSTLFSQKYSKIFQLPDFKTFKKTALVMIPINSKKSILNHEYNDGPISNHRYLFTKKIFPLFYSKERISSRLLFTPSDIKKLEFSKSSSAESMRELLTDRVYNLYLYHQALIQHVLEKNNIKEIFLKNGALLNQLVLFKTNKQTILDDSSLLKCLKFIQVLEDNQAAARRATSEMASFFDVISNPKNLLHTEVKEILTEVKEILLENQNEKSIENFCKLFQLIESLIFENIDLKEHSSYPSHSSIEVSILEQDKHYPLSAKTIRNFYLGKEKKDQFQALLDEQENLENQINESFKLGKKPSDLQARLVALKTQLINLLPHGLDYTNYLQLNDFLEELLHSIRIDFGPLETENKEALRKAVLEKTGILTNSDPNEKVDFLFKHPDKSSLSYYLTLEMLINYRDPDGVLTKIKDLLAKGITDTVSKLHKIEIKSGKIAQQECSLIHSIIKIIDNFEHNKVEGFNFKDLISDIKKVLTEEEVSDLHLLLEILGSFEPLLSKNADLICSSFARHATSFLDFKSAYRLFYLLNKIRSSEKQKLEQRRDYIAAMNARPLYQKVWDVTRVVGKTLLGIEQEEFKDLEEE